MNFEDAVKTCFNKYACFEGRACRSEYWYFCLFNSIAGLVIGIICGVISAIINTPASAALGIIYTLAVLLPSLGVAVRRLHDVGKSGWFLLINLIPYIGEIGRAHV